MGGSAAAVADTKLWIGLASFDEIILSAENGLDYSVENHTFAFVTSGKIQFDRWTDRRW